MNSDDLIKPQLGHKRIAMIWLNHSSVINE